MSGDLISRKAMLDKMKHHKSLFSTNQDEYMFLTDVDKARADEIDNCIADLRNATDAELEVFEFCASGENPCKEYDQQKHCCHRWTKVIRQTVEEMRSQQSEQKKGEWVKVGHWGRSYKCNQCGNYLDFDGVNAGRGDANFCPNCGADMSRGE